MQNLNVNVDPNSPLKDLYKSQYDFSGLFYPKNLAQENRGHWINFYINVHNRSNYLDDGFYSVGDKNYITTDMNGVTQTLQNKQGVVTSDKYSMDLEKVPGGLLKGKLSLGRQTKRITQAISLYMPDTVNVNYDAEWEDASLTEMFGKALAIPQAGLGVVDTLADKFLGTGASKNSLNAPAAELLGNLAQESGIQAQSAIFHATGTAINPQLQVLFKGVGLRQFQFDFLFSPRDAAEAKNVDNIIRAFRFHMMPELDKGFSGRYLIPPSEFDIDFVHNGRINDKLHKITTCVLKSVNIDYAPNGWSTFHDGSPVQSRMTLQFQEVEMLTKERIDQGF